MRKSRVALAVLLFLAGCDDDRITECDCPPEPGPTDIMAALVYSYQTRDLAVFTSLLAHDPDRNAEYTHVVCDTVLGSTSWGYDEEICIHKRLFQPEDPCAGEPPVPPEAWLRSISLHLTQLEPFQERADLYSTSDPVGADGKLDPAIWKAVDARYGTDVFFDTQGENDFQVTGEANFVVIEDKTKAAGKSGRFLLLSWEEPCNPMPLTATGLQSLPRAP